MASSKHAAGIEQRDDSASARSVKARFPFLSTINWEAINQVLRLSRRESEIAYLLLADFSEIEIATQLKISAHTVHSHFERLYRKLHVRSRCTLIITLFETWVSLGMPMTVTVKPAHDGTGAHSA